MKTRIEKIGNAVGAILAGAVVLTFLMILILGVIILIGLMGKLALAIWA